MKKSLTIISLLLAGALSGNAAYSVTTDDSFYTNPAAWLYVWTGSAGDNSWDSGTNWDYYQNATDQDASSDSSHKPISSDPAFIGYNLSIVDGKQVLTANNDSLTVTMTAWPSTHIYLGTNVTLQGNDNGFNTGTTIDFADFSGTSTITMGPFWKRGDVNFTGSVTMTSDTFEYTLFTSSALNQDAGVWNGSGINVVDALGNTLTYSADVTDAAGFYYIEKTQSDGITTIKLRATAVPEPATATLSLLALAGLAARRRRK